MSTATAPSAALSPLPSKVAALQKLLRRTTNTANGHAGAARRWERFAQMHEGPQGHAEARERCLARVQRELRLQMIWAAYAGSVREALATLTQDASLN